MDKPTAKDGKRRQTPLLSGISVVVLLLLAGLVLGGVACSASGPAETGTPAEKSAVQQQSQEETVYTCPMHPEVRQSEPGKCPKCKMDLVLAEADK